MQVIKDDGFNELQIVSADFQDVCMHVLSL